VHELDRGRRGDVRPPAGRRREEDEQGAKPLAAGLERLGADLGDDAAVRPDRRLEPLLELLQVGVEARCGAEVGERAQRAVPVWSATIPPARSRKDTSPNPVRSRRPLRSAGPGNRRTLAGR
jgi:hypothetical protein